MEQQKKEKSLGLTGQMTFTSFFRYLYSPPSKKGLLTNSTACVQAGNLKKSKYGIDSCDLDEPGNAPTTRRFLKFGINKLLPIQTSSRISKLTSSNCLTEATATGMTGPFAPVDPSSTKAVGGLTSSAAECPDLCDSDSAKITTRCSQDSPRPSVSSPTSIPEAFFPTRSKSASMHLSPSVGLKSSPISPDSSQKCSPSSPEVFSSASYRSPWINSESPSPSSLVKSVKESPETNDSLVGGQPVPGITGPNSIPSSQSANNLEQSSERSSGTSLLWTDDNGYSYARPVESQSPAPKAKVKKSSSAGKSAKWRIPVTGVSSVQSNSKSVSPASVLNTVSPEINSCASKSSASSRWLKLSPANVVDVADEPQQSAFRSQRSLVPEDKSPVVSRGSGILKKGWPSAPDILQSSSRSNSNDMTPNGSTLAWHELASPRVSHQQNNEASSSQRPQGSKSLESDELASLRLLDDRHRPVAFSEPASEALNDTQQVGGKSVASNSCTGKAPQSFFRGPLSFGNNHNLIASTLITSDLEKLGSQTEKNGKSKAGLFRSRSIDFARRPITKGLLKFARKSFLGDDFQRAPEVQPTKEIKPHHIRRSSFDSATDFLNTAQRSNANMVAVDKSMGISNMVSTTDNPLFQELSGTWTMARELRELEQQNNSGNNDPLSGHSGQVTGLPPDLWQLVFSFLPRQQILGYLRAVCKEWQTVIDSPLFLPHLKQYQILYTVENKPSLADSARRVERWLSESQLTTVAGLMSHFRCSPFSTAPIYLSPSLRRHYHTVQENDSPMVECWSNCMITLDVLSKEFKDDSWSLALVLILFVSERPVLQEIIKIMLSGKAGASRIAAVEFLYLILTAITASCWEDCRQPLLCELESAMRYIEFVEGKESECGLVCFTTEQNEMLDTDLSPDEIMVVQAFPGTGKTSTLLEYAKRRAGLTFAYLIFDRFLATEAEMVLAPNTKCINFRKLAYAKVGWQYRHKLHSNNLSAFLVKTALGVPSHTAVYFILLTLEQFLRSPDLTMKDCHVPRKAVYCTSSGTSMEVSYFLEMADKLWHMMIDKGSREIPMTHNGYLKLYQLSEPRLDYQYDCLLCDEVQNASPVMIDIVLRQIGCSKILVGDPHQVIHGFEDVGDPIQTLAKDLNVIRHKLTLSFRFGPEIASTCNALLHLKEERTAMLGVKSIPDRHVTAIGNVHSDLTFTGRERGGQNGQVTVLARSNARVFEAALQCSRRRLGFVGGIKGYQFDLMSDTWHLMKGNRAKIQDLYIKSFSNYMQMIEVAQQTGDLELLTRIKIVEANQMDLPRKIEAIRAVDVGTDLTSAHVLFGTAHKVKGLEFDVVALTNDFLELSTVKSLDGKFFVNEDSLPEGIRQVDVQELNLLYVAASRAKTRLLLNADLDNYLFLHAAGLRGEPRVLLMHIKETMSCIACLKACNSCLAIVAGCLNDVDDGIVHKCPPSNELKLLEGPSSSLGIKLNQQRSQQTWRVCVCLDCARQQQTVPLNLSAGVKMIARVFA